MRLRNVRNAVEIVNNSPYVIKETTRYKGKINELFGNNNPVCVEVGMGKGDFIIGLATINPDINYIDIEMYESVLVRAIQKLADKDLPNLKFMCMDASIIDLSFEYEVTTLYLNFSDPWPKKKHERRRLTSEAFLNRYETIFVANPHIIQKTDNIHLFAYSLASLSKFGYTLNKVSLDLAESDIPNVLTEYEKKFMSKGVKINYLDAVKYLQK